MVPARRTLHLRLDELRHLRLNELSDPEPIPRDTDFATVLISDQPVVVQAAAAGSVGTTDPDGRRYQVGSGFSAPRLGPP